MKKSYDIQTIHTWDWIGVSTFFFWDNFSHLVMMIEPVPHQDEPEGNKNSDDFSLNGESWLANWNERCKTWRICTDHGRTLGPDLEVSSLLVIEAFFYLWYESGRIRQIGPGKGWRLSIFSEHWREPKYHNVLHMECDSWTFTQLLKEW